MSYVTGFLQVMAQNDADELVLRLGSPPSFTRAGLPVEVFMRPLGPDRHAQVVKELIDDQRRLELAAQGEISFEREGEVAVRVEVKNPDSPRIRLSRLRAEPEPVPVQAAAPLLRLVEPSEAGPARQEAPASPAALPPAEVTLREVPRALQALLDHATERGASDLHLATGEPAVLRVDGRLLPLGDGLHDVEGMLAGLLDPEARGRLGAGSVDRAFALPSGDRFRLNAYRCDQGVAVAIRVLRRGAPELGSLNLPPGIEDLISFSHGLVLVVGPTGSGKSTTLAALARRALERRRGVLVTLEDPVEYTFPQIPGALVRQREIGRHVRDFASGLRDALREDPDLLLVGEMRDPESIQLALTAAETGHLVLASLHSRSATSAVERIVDGYPPERQRQIRVQLADALRAVVSQRLLPRRDGAGRVPAVEILRVNRAACTLIREGKTQQLVSVVQTGAAEGMIPLERSLDELVRTGRVHPQVARAATEDGHADAS